MLRTTLVLNSERTGRAHAALKRGFANVNSMLAIFTGNDTADAFMGNLGELFLGHGFVSRRLYNR